MGDKENTTCWSASYDCAKQCLLHIRDGMLVECMYSSFVLEVGLSQSTVSSPLDQWSFPEFWGVIKMIKMKYLVRTTALILLSQLLVKNSQKHNLPWHVLHGGPSGLYWALLGCSRRYWSVLDCNGLYSVLGWPGLYWATSGQYWVLLCFTGLYWASLSGTGH